MVRMRQPRPDSGLGFQVKSLQPFKLFPFRSTVFDGELSDKAALRRLRNRI